MISKDQMTVLVPLVTILIGIGLEYFGYQLIHYYNHKKIGYAFIVLGVLVLFVNVITMISKTKK